MEENGGACCKKRIKLGYELWLFWRGLLATYPFLVISTFLVLNAFLTEGSVPTPEKMGTACLKDPVPLEDQKIGTFKATHSIFSSWLPQNFTSKV
jgi:hypothetical protein